jgi:hypothetical protein
VGLSAFTCRLGQGQGRLRTPQATAGDYAFVLGDVEPGRSFELAPGDHAEVTQAVDLSDASFVRALLRLRVPASTPGGLAWEASIVVDGMKVARMRAKPGREGLATDLVANVSKLAGIHTIGVRLELVLT